MPQHLLPKKGMFVTKNNQKKPKFYSSHRTRQSFRKNTKDQANDFQDIKKLLETYKKNILEIGFGTGTSIIQLYERNKNSYFCIESYSLGVENIKKFIKKNNIEDIHVFDGDAIEIIENYFSDNSLDEILIFFPDPWPKKKHEKRRILNKFSLNMFIKKLKTNGLIHFATDHINYAYSAKELMCDYTKNKVTFNNNRRYRPITNYEIRGIKRKNFIFDIILKKE